MHPSAETLLKLTFVIAGILAPVSALAGGGGGGGVSCETFNPCTAGICLEDGTCEASPANDGQPCDTFSPCSSGVCNDGNCDSVPANDGDPCQTVDPCMEEDGQCSAGECVGDTLPNGSTCREDIMGPCVTGTCTTIVTFTFCNPVFKCDQPNGCDVNCNPFTGACESFPTNVCDEQCVTATCEPDGEFGHTCTNPTNKPNDSPCNNGSTCDVNDTCQAGTCIGDDAPAALCGDGEVDAPEECDDGDTDFESGEACDPECMLIPCGKPTNSTGVLPKASDALFTLKVAVQAATCALSVCDVNSSNTITATDALNILKKAVSTPVTLNCPAGGGGA
jgi:hypothetical protein